MILYIFNISLYANQKNNSKLASGYIILKRSKLPSGKSWLILTSFIE